MSVYMCFGRLFGRFMRQLIGRGQLAPIGLTGVRWTDVDTPEDYAKAEMLLGAAMRRRASREITAAVA